MPLIRPDEQDPYHLLTSIVVPRPIAWVSTVSADGVGNLAPHSFFSVACAHPPIVSFTSVGAKDTLANVLATGEFTVSVATEALHEQVNASSAPYARDVDEAVALGLETTPSGLVAPPRVAASPAALECRLHSTTELGDSTLVLGEVVAFWVDDDALVDGLPDIDRLRPVSRLGRNQWGRPPEVFALDRPARPPA
ncbi:flavin reductase [Nocardioides perillae]|uniref:Flavin reductase (DIM6/NTAB) family NADH-FMN oxidoreductase RutF n=1 Tax=Nocardioides perillae TaxID=1119534 RepID=A0A7Y9UMZ6_9ACTN|nr:flavin reductase (DIM6/NTAB) family NADH-FMN oxidoreductase RutF [Nocardioides perillae]